MMAKTELRPRVMGALGVVALSLFLLICLMSYGQGGFEDAGQLGWQAWIGSLLLEVFGAGAYVLVLSPLAWGVVVYFQERTPQLRLRAAGTIVLAISVAVIAGLLQGGRQDIWAGAVGSGAAAVVGWISTLVGPPIAQALAWTLATGTFVVSLVVATDWIFHTLRRGGRPVIARFVAPPLPPAPAPDVVDDGVDDEERRRMIEAALVASIDDEPEEAIEAEEIALAESHSVDHVPGAAVSVDPAPVDHAPVEPGAASHAAASPEPEAYAGVEFMPPSDELAVPDTRTSGPAYVRASIAEPGSIEDEWRAVEAHEAAAQPADVDADTPAAVHETDDTAPADAAFDPLVHTVEATDEEARVVDEEYVAGHAGPIQPATEPETAAESAPVIDEYYAVETPDANQVRGGDVAPTEPASTEPASTEPASTGISASGISAAGIAAEILDGEPAGGREAEAAGSEEEPGLGTRLLFDDAARPAAAADHPAGQADDLAPRDAELPHNRLSQHMIVDDLVVPAAIHELDEVSLGDVIAPETEFEPAPRSLDGLELDSRFRAAVDVVLSREKASAMVLQRHLAIGYPRAVRLLEQMTVAGIVGPDEGDWSGARRILVTHEEWEAFIAAHSA